MSDYESPPQSGGSMRYVLLAVAGLYVLASLYLLFDMRGKIATLEAAQATSTANQQQMGARLDSSEARVKATTEMLAEKLGMTEKELEARTAELQRQQKVSVSRLMKEQKEQISAVTGKVEDVKSEVGTVRTDVATTRSELAATREKLERTIGDLGVQSGLIARNSDDLAELKRKGERNYYEFALLKGKPPTPLATISLQLKKADSKKSKFTMNVL
ncbi:MAG: hypothetical protein ACRD2R_02520, partial [Terriglobales bacterium]